MIQRCSLILLLLLIPASVWAWNSWRIIRSLKAENAMAQQTSITLKSSLKTLQSKHQAALQDYNELEESNNCPREKPAPDRN